jgi:hypothetical protein
MARNRTAQTKPEDTHLIPVRCEACGATFAILPNARAWHLRCPNRTQGKYTPRYRTYHE